MPDPSPLIMMLAGAPPDLPAPTAQDQAAWYDVIPRWQAAVSAFETARDNLLAHEGIASSDPALQAEWQSQVDAMNSAEDKIREIAAAIDDVKNWLSGAWDAIKGVWQSTSSKVKGWFGLGSPPSYLGFAPVVWLIGVGVVSSAIVYIGHVTSGAVDTTKRLELLNSYVAQGLTPSQAADAVDQVLGTPDKGVTSNLADIAKYLAIATAFGVGGYVLFQWFRNRQHA